MDNWYASRRRPIAIALALFWSVVLWLVATNTNAGLLGLVALGLFGFFPLIGEILISVTRDMSDRHRAVIVPASLVLLLAALLTASIFLLAEALS